MLVNEFGDVGIDGEVLKGCGIESCPEENIVELANGCICCTVADDFVPALDQILGREPRVDHILIETSGLALPKPLVQAFQWPGVRSRVTVDSVVAVVDGPALAEGRVAQDLAALAAQRAADPSLDARRSGRGGVRRPGGLRRPDRAVEGRPARRRARGRRRGRGSSGISGGR